MKRALRVGVLLVVAGLAAAGSEAAGLGRRPRGSLAIQDLGTLGGRNSHARSINEKGAVLGASDTAGNVAVHAFLWRRGRMTDQETLGGRNSFPGGSSAINDKGMVVGAADTQQTDA